MKNQFLEKCGKFSNLEFLSRRIDIPCDFGFSYDKVFMSFVIHGFPHTVRLTVLKNIYNHLKPGGAFFMLDFAEFDMRKMPSWHRFIFKSIECKYAFDFIERDWKQVLADNGFSDFRESFFFKNYVRLLKARK